MIQIIKDPTALAELKKHAEKSFGNLVKGVVDIEKELMAINGELHSDEEALLLELGSVQNNLWGINIYTDLPKDKRIEFDSMINLRPSLNNLSRGVDNPKIQEKIITIVNKLIKE